MLYKSKVTMEKDGDGCIRLLLKGREETMKLKQIEDVIIRCYASHKDIPEGHHDGEVIGHLTYCRDCEGFDGRRCLWWPDHPEVPESGYCYQAERREE